MDEPSARELRLYEAQRAALHGWADADVPVTIDQVRDLAHRNFGFAVTVVVDPDGMAPMDAVATPSESRLRFHPDSLTLWVAVHEVTHLLVPQDRTHGRVFVSSLIELVNTECGAAAADRLHAEVLRHAVPMRIGPDRFARFVLRTRSDTFIHATRTRVTATTARMATRWTTRPAAERAARRATSNLGTPVEIVQLT